MSGYQHILAALDLMPDHDQVSQRAAELARRFDAHLSLVHVVEVLHVDLANELVLPQDVELESQLVESARRKLAHTADTLQGVGKVDHSVEQGATKHEILRVADEKGVDLIVIGSHGRHGIGRLLGSTANAVLHGAACDVLAVRIAER